jgi:hypothetical protein
VNGDLTATYVAIAFVGLLGGYNVRNLIVLLQRRRRRTRIFTAREAVFSISGFFHVSRRAYSHVQTCN